MGKPASEDAAPQLAVRSYPELHPATRLLLLEVVGGDVSKKLWPEDRTIWQLVRQTVAPRSYEVLKVRMGSAVPLTNWLFTSTPVPWAEVGSELGISADGAGDSGRRGINALRKADVLGRLQSEPADADLASAGGDIGALAARFRSASKNEYLSLYWFGYEASYGNDRPAADLTDVPRRAAIAGRVAGVASAFLLSAAERRAKSRGVDLGDAAQKISDAGLCLATHDLIPVDVFIRGFLPVGATIGGADACIADTSRYGGLLGKVIADLQELRPANAAAVAGKSVRYAELDDERAAAGVLLERAGRGTEAAAAVMHAAHLVWYWLDDAANESTNTATVYAVADHVLALAAMELGFAADALNQRWSARTTPLPPQFADHEGLGPQRAAYVRFRERCSTLTAEEARRVCIAARRTEDSRYAYLSGLWNHRSRPYSEARGGAPMYLAQPIRRAIMDAAVAIMYRDKLDANAYQALTQPWQGVAEV